MGLPARRPSLELAEQRFGKSTRWARDAALVGGWTGWSGGAAFITSLMFSGPELLRSLAVRVDVPVLGVWMDLTPIHIAAGVVGVVFGGVLGMAAPMSLDWVRGLLPIPALALCLPVAAGGLAAGFGAMTAAAFGASVLPAAVFGVVTGSLQTGASWLPYTVASVVGLPRWPVLGGAMLVGPFAGLLAALALALL